MQKKVILILLYGFDSNHLEKKEEKEKEKEEEEEAGGVDCISADIVGALAVSHLTHCGLAHE